MKKRQLKYQWGEHHLQILVGDHLEPRIKMLFWFELILTGALASIFLFRAFIPGREWVNWSMGIGAAILYLLATWRFLARIYFREKIILTNSHLILVQKTLFHKSQQKFDWNHVGHLHYIGREKKTAHPLKGGHFDYFGFDTHEHLIRSLHQEGSLYFTYEGYPVRFAKGIYSWDAEDIVRMMKLYMGDTLQLGAEWRTMAQEHEWDDLGSN